MERSAFGAAVCVTSGFAVAWSCFTTGRGAMARSTGGAVRDTGRGVDTSVMGAVACVTGNSGCGVVACSGNFTGAALGAGFTIVSGWTIG